MSEIARVAEELPEPFVAPSRGDMLSEASDRLELAHRKMYATLEAFRCGSVRAASQMTSEVVELLRGLDRLLLDVEHQP